MDVSNRRIVIVGKTGAGKSSLANTIFGEDVFKIDHGLNFGTSECQAETRSVNGKKITLIDTPGFFDTDRSEDELKPEIVRCITECAPGPHAFLIVLKVERFTVQEQEVIKKLHQYFSEEVFKYATVVFTHGDQLPEGQTIEDHVHQNELVSDLVEKCGGRCFVIDNKHWNNNQKDEYMSNQFQVEELLKSIDKMTEANNGSCYTNEMLQAVEEEIQQEEERLIQSSGNMSEEEIRKQAKVKVSKMIWIRVVGITTGALLGALCGVVVVGAVCAVVAGKCKYLVRLAISGAAVAGGAAVVTGGAVAVAEGTAVVAGGTAAVAEGAAVVAGGTAAGGTAAVAGGIAAAVVVGTVATIGGVLGGMTGFEAAGGADTTLEAIKRAAVAVKDDAKSVYDAANDAFDKMSISKSKQS